MLNLFYCLLAPSVAPAEALDRYVALRRKAPAVEVVYRSGGLKGHLTLVPDKRMRLEAKAGGLDYLCVITPQGTRELDRVDRQYDDQYNTRIMAPPSRISGAGQTFPAWVSAPDFRTMVPKGTTFTSEGRRTIGKVSGDLVKASYTMDGGEHSVEVVIDNAGIPVHVLMHGQTSMGGYRREWNVDALKPIQAPPTSFFTFSVPDGYVPFSLDVIPGPIGVGDTLPLRGWGGIDLAKRMAKGGLVAILSADSEPSRRAGAALAKIRSAGTPVVTLGDAGGVPGAEGYATPKLLEELHVPSTPIFFKIDGKGKISAVWLGFDPAATNQFVSEATGR